VNNSHKQGVRSGWRALGRFLLDLGAMAPGWIEPFERVDRSRFLPETIWPFDEKTGHGGAVSVAEDPDEWFAYVDADVPITIQWDDGQHDGPEPGALPTSSASMPSLVMSMLFDLDVQDRMHVLEIGTGTGWNAALLAHRLGGHQVTTVEVDRQVASTARACLHEVGLHPHVMAHDGALGCQSNAPYDRVIVTCGVRSIASAWIEQTRRGGVILAPWGTFFGNEDAVVRLSVQRHGTASGHFTRPAQFMKMRSQRPDWPDHQAYVPEDWVTQASQSSTAITAKEFSGGTYDIVPFVVGLRVRDCAHISAGESAWFYSLSDKSWAAVRFATKDSEGEVYQSGTRRLWDEIEASLTWWEAQGRPGHERFGLTVTPDAEFPWLDDPENRI
jgi:protein-L-isoaspartate O-methyltransferase